LKRLVYKDLLEWKESKDRKPLILKGVRQCGKTWILKEFGKNNYEDVAYFNFEGNEALQERFSQDLNVKRIIEELSILNNKIIKPEKTLIIFDEIQFCNKALTSLKYFYEDAPEYHIVCAGSLLGIFLSQPLSFPVGKVDFLELRPMNFYEFLLANDEEMLIEYLNNNIEKVPTTFENKLQNYLKNYYIVGGMPEVVEKWITTKDIEQVEKIQDIILNSYELDFAKHAPLSDTPKLSLIWDYIPRELSKENSKFVYGHVKQGARAKDLEDALQWLISAGMCYKVNKIQKPNIPISAYIDIQSFKIYMSDIGLLRRKAKVDASVILLDNKEIYKEFKGAIAENFVLLELLSLNKEVPFYWTSGNTAEVDFIWQLKDKVIPFEVKSGENIGSRSLTLYRQKYNPEISVKTSMKNVDVQDGVINIPLYLLWNLKKYLYLDNNINLC
jgi:predicted AAA+ superfamily ATPase